MNSLCREAVMRHFSHSKKTELKAQIPALRNPHLAENFMNVIIACDKHGYYTISYHKDRTFNVFEKAHQSGGDKVEKYTPDQIVEFFLHNKINKKGNVIERLYIMNSKVALKVLSELEPLATIKGLYLHFNYKIPLNPGVLAKFQSFRELSLASTHSHLTSEILEEVKSVKVQRLYLSFNGYVPENFFIEASMLQVTNKSDEDDEMFWNFAKKFQQGAFDFRHGSFYKSKTTYYFDEDDFFSTVLSNFPQAQKFGEMEAKDGLCVPICNSTKVVRFLYDEEEKTHQAMVWGMAVLR